MKRIASTLLLTALLLCTTSVVFAAEEYDIDSGHSFVGFTVKHMGVSSVRGEFKEFTADLQVDGVIETNVSIVRDSLRVSVILIDALPRERPVWDKRYADS